MPKGNQGQSCADAIRDSLGPGEIATFTTLFERVKQQGGWSWYDRGPRRPRHKKKCQPAGSEDWHPGGASRMCAADSPPPI
jgi:hypothetical protein